MSFWISVSKKTTIITEPFIITTAMVISVSGSMNIVAAWIKQWIMTLNLKQLKINLYFDEGISLSEVPSFLLF